MGHVGGQEGLHQDKGTDTEWNEGVGFSLLHSTCARHLGCVLPPLLGVPLDRVVLDELHLLLKIMDIPIRNLILYADSKDDRQRAHHGVEQHHIRKLEQTIRSCGVDFQIWQIKEPTGKLASYPGSPPLRNNFN